MAGPLRTHVSFDADYPEEPDDDGSPAGKALVSAIHDGLTGRGVDCELIEESDYAFSFGARSGDSVGLVMVGHVGDSDGRQWLAFVEPVSLGIIRRTRSDVSAVVRALHDVVVRDLGVEPQWFTEQQWNDPAFGQGAPAPEG